MVFLQSTTFEVFHSPTSLPLCPSHFADVFYYLENEEYKEPMTVVSSSKKSIRTQCCKSISFIASPTFIYLDTSKYPVGSSQNVFTFSFSSMPSDGVTITPTMLTNESVAVAAVESRPSVLKFTSAYSSGSFFFYGPVNFAGSFLFALNVSGPSANEYFPVIAASINILSAYEPLPSPNFIGASFAANGLTLKFTFDGPTDYGRVSSVSWVCGQLFLFPGSNISSCQWTSPFSVQVTLSSSAVGSSVVNPGAVVSLLPLRVRAACLNSNPTYCDINKATPSVRLVIKAPLSPLSPVAILNIPTAVTTCDDLIIDASGSVGNAGRPWMTIQWTVTSDNNAAFEIQNILDDINSLSKPVTVSKKLLFPGTYTITFSLQNFLLATSSTQTTMRVVNTLIPSVQILGASLIAIIPSQSLRVTSATAVPSCNGTSPQLKQSWSVLLGNVILPDLQSTSVNPTVLRLQPYSLSVGYTYNMIFTASLGAATSSASVTVSVVHGQVIAIVVGGYVRQSPIDSPFSMDASSSFDEDQQPGTTSQLTFSWMCKVLSLNAYGSDCSTFYVQSSLNQPLGTVASDSMTVNSTYSFNVLVQSPDGRSDNKSVTVSPSLPGSVLVSILSKKVEINSDQRLSLTGIAFANFSIIASWAVFFNSNPIPLPALTPTTQYFSSAEARTNINFPLAVPGNVFSPGSTLTFQLLGCAALDAHKCSFSQVVILIHSPPYDGSLSVDPTRGYALTTQFSINALGWLADTTSYPLSYSFSFQLSPALPTLTVASASLLTFATSTFPAGLVGRNFTIAVIGIVRDSFGASSNATSYPQVMNDPSVNVENVLSSTIKSFTSTGNVNILFQVVNNVATTFNAVNCSASPSCSVLNRKGCLQTPNTCGSCLKGFAGVVGDSNSKCSNVSTLFASGQSGQLGSTCVVDSDCILGFCSGLVCSAPFKQCPSNTPAADCSGHGSCSYFDISGVALATPCTILSIFCNTKCICSDGYGGIECSLSPSQALLVDVSRTQMCTALLQAIQIQDLSSHLLDTIAGSLQQTYSPYEIKSLAGNTACSQVLVFLSSAASQGFLSGALPTTGQLIAEIISSFVVVSGDDTNHNVTRQAVLSSLDGLTSGVLKTMVRSIMLKSC